MSVLASTYETNAIRKQTLANKFKYVNTIFVFRSM